MAPKSKNVHCTCKFVCNQPSLLAMHFVNTSSKGSGSIWLKKNHINGCSGVVDDNISARNLVEFQELTKELQNQPTMSS